jgi:hypothetical protein
MHLPSDVNRRRRGGCRCRRAAESGLGHGAIGVKDRTTSLKFQAGDPPEIRGTVNPSGRGLALAVCRSPSAVTIVG